MEERNGNRKLLEVRMSLQAYRERYATDIGNNLLLVFQNEERAALVSMQASPSSNRTLSQQWYNGLSAAQKQDIESTALAQGYFDQAGLQQKSMAISSILWNYQNQLAMQQSSNPSGEEVREYSVFNGGGVRSRKTTQTSDSAGKITSLEIVFYFGSLEYRQSYRGTDLSYDGETVSEDGEEVTPEDSYSSLRVREGHRQVVQVESYSYRSGEADESVESQWYLDNHIDSVSLVVSGEGEVQRGEGYYPYGGTSWSLGNMNSQRYGYSGQEKESNGLYYYGFRSYDPSQYRWLSPDPAGFAGGLNRYAMVGNNPVSTRDMFGLTKEYPYISSMDGYERLYKNSTYDLVASGFVRKNLPNNNDRGIERIIEKYLRKVPLDFRISIQPNERKPLSILDTVWIEEEAQVKLEFAYVNAVATAYHMIDYAIHELVVNKGISPHVSLITQMAFGFKPLSTWSAGEKKDKLKVAKTRQAMSKVITTLKSARSVVHSLIAPTRNNPVAVSNTGFADFLGRPPGEITFGQTNTIDRTIHFTTHFMSSLNAVGRGDKKVSSNELNLYMFFLATIIHESTHASVSNTDDNVYHEIGVFEKESVTYMSPVELQDLNLHVSNADSYAFFATFLSYANKRFNFTNIDRKSLGRQFLKAAQISYACAVGEHYSAFAKQMNESTFSNGAGTMSIDSNELNTRGLGRPVRDRGPWTNESYKNPKP